MPRQPFILALFALPATLIFLLFFVGPFAYFAVMSFWSVSFYRISRNFTFANYIDVYREYFYSLGFTFAIALAIAILTTVIAFAFAYLIRFRAGRLGPALLFVTLITMFGGYLVKIYAWRTILGTTGILNTGLQELGLTSEPLPWLLYNPGAVVTTLTHFLLPFAVLPIYGSLRGVSDAQLAAARDLGARPVRTLFDIVLPQCELGLVVAFMLAFFIAAGDYITPRLVGGTSTAMVGNFVENQFITALDAPQSSALAVAILLISAGTILGLRTILHRVLVVR
jgi:spermidine/putrescine transport system permease protein